MSQQWFDYPVFQGNAYVTTYKGPGTDTPHYAYDIETPFHTPLTAPLPGTVEISDYQPWGGEIFIKPDNPLYPEYYFYHPDELEVSKGDHVGSGQIIALSGGENPGYPGAEHPAQPEWSSGAHTHLGWFTGWKSTPIGTRPYGPDPANLLAIAKGLPATSPFFSLSASSAGSSNFSLPTANTFGRLGIGAAGVLLIGIGIFSMLAMTGVTEKATGLAKKAVKLGVLA